jgi:hypothetical protein
MIENKRSKKFRKAFPLGSSRAGVSMAHFMRIEIGPLPKQSALVYIFKEGLSTKPQCRMIVTAGTNVLRQ